MPGPIEVIINANSGGVVEGNTDLLIAEAFAARNVDVKIHFAKGGDEIDKLAKRAAESDAEIIVAGGGDGTISAVASEAVRSKKTLGVLPLGTLNNFSKDLQSPQDLSEAVRVIAEGHTRVIDVGEVNENIFINNSSIGLYPRIVKKREQNQQKTLSHVGEYILARACSFSAHH